MLNERASFDLARRLRSEQGAELGEVFSFLSGLYFRGKLAYARAFARAPIGLPGAVVITPNRGLLPAEQPVTIADLISFAEVDIDVEDARYREPLQRDARKLDLALGDSSEFVLLGSVATPKYVRILSDVFGDRLLLPEQFVGRGDMSRGGLLLRCVESRQELDYVPVGGVMRHGPRPPKLPRKT